jgi:hypothetical protein
MSFIVVMPPSRLDYKFSCFGQFDPSKSCLIQSFDLHRGTGERYCRRLSSIKGSNPQEFRIDLKRTLKIFLSAV